MILCMICSKMKIARSAGGAMISAHRSSAPGISVRVRRPHRHRLPPSTCHTVTQRTVLGVLVVVGFGGVDLLAVEVLALEVAGRGALRLLVSSVGQVHHCQRVCRSVTGHAVCCPT